MAPRGSPSLDDAPAGLLLGGGVAAVSAFAADYDARTAAGDGSGVLPNDPEPGRREQIESSAIGGERVEPTSAGIDRVGLDRGGPMLSGVFDCCTDELRADSRVPVRRRDPEADHREDRLVVHRREVTGPGEPPVAAPGTDGDPPGRRPVPISEQTGRHRPGLDDLAQRGPVPIAAARRVLRGGQAPEHVPTAGVTGSTCTSERYGETVEVQQRAC